MNSKIPPSLFKGIDLFNQEKFFKAHAIWESDWLRVPEKKLYQGLIMIAAALVHYQRRNVKYALRFIEEGSKKLEEYKGNPWIDILSFLLSLMIIRDKIISQEHFTFPKINLK